MHKFHRRNLPHLYDSEGIFFITFRLFDSIPLSALKKLPHKLNDMDFVKFKRLFQKYDSILDSVNSGINLIKKKIPAEICRSALHHHDGKDYKLICYTIMPNHVHLVFELLPGNNGISKIMQGIKGASARRCNIALKRNGKFWQDESYDRMVRNDIELYFIIKYHYCPTV
jgi:REP-associated tyrosine transposase